MNSTEDKLRFHMRRPDKGYDVKETKKKNPY